MADINIEKKDKDRDDIPDDSGNRNKRNNWWVWAVVVILAIIIAWIALSDRNDVDEDGPQPAISSAVVTMNTSQGVEV